MEHNSEDSKLSVCIQYTGMSILEFYLRKKKAEFNMATEQETKKVL